MFDPVSFPYGAKMLFNTVKLKSGVAMDDAELCTDSKELGYDMLWQGEAAFVDDPGSGA